MAEKRGIGKGKSFRIIKVELAFLTNKRYGNETDGGLKSQKSIFWDVWMMTNSLPQGGEQWSR
jgi:hypothetical protein